MRLWRFLRSRTLAVWTIIAFSVYAAVATTVSNGDWSVPYRNPIFLAIAALLTVSTGACAWERTRAAIRTAPMREPSAASIERLWTNAPIVVPTAAFADPLASAEQALQGLHMRVVRHGDVLEARGGMAGAFGSPVFHWALALLFVVVALGQLTRAEGMMGVVAGYAKPDAPEAYGSLEKGPWAGDLTGRVIGVPSIESTFTANGVEQGVTPYVEIRSADGAILASGHAYANHPIRYHAMLVHASNNGLGAVVQISDGDTSFNEQVLLDYDEERSSVEPGVIGIAGPDGAVLATVILEPADESTPDDPRVRIRAVEGDAVVGISPPVDTVVPEGTLVELPGGITLTVVELTKYARLSVVNDWSVYYIYALFGFAVIGLSLAVFAPLRGARVMLVDDGEGPRLHVAVRHGRGDPHFPGRVEAALRLAFEPGEEP